MINPFQHNFDNGVHISRAAVCADHYVVVTYGRQHCTLRGVPTVRYHVQVSLYGRDWSERDVELADRHSGYLSADTTLAQAREVARFRSRSASTYLSLALRA